MDRQISSDLSEGITALLKQFCHIEEGDEQFGRLYKCILTKVKKSGTMYFLNKSEIDQNITGMAEKFNFHGFFLQAEALKCSYEKYITMELPKPELMNRLNVVKFLLCLSETPTTKFMENPEYFQITKDNQEEEIDWREYLNDGLENWSPTYCVTSDDDTDVSIDSNDITNNTQLKTNEVWSTIPIQIKSYERNTIADFRANREELLNTIQHSWYNLNSYHEYPRSKHKEANVEILWENFLKNEAMGLVTLPEISIISEYKVIREILWQLWMPHASAVFELDINNIKVKSNITIASTRLPTFQYYLESEFVPYIELMKFFKDFSKTLESNSYEGIDVIPTTYKCYNNSLKNLITPIYVKLTKLEDTVKEQETTYTLLNLAEELHDILKPVFILSKIHNQVILDHMTHSNLVCASTLLVKLHNHLSHTESILEYHLTLTLFLESLQHYFSIIDNWFVKNDFTDYCNEFPIIRKTMCFSPDTSFSDCDIWKLNFDVSYDLNDDCCNDGIIKIIRNTVLQIGRNLHLLRLLGNFSFLNESTETIHQQFLRKVVEEICTFFRLNANDLVTTAFNMNDENEVELKYKFPVIWSENVEKPQDMDKCENLIDSADGFLMFAFEDYLFDKPEKVEETKPNLFDQISSVSQSFFPVIDFFENILKDILKERFTISGLMVKKMLIEQYALEKQFQFLRHIFMFQDDLIFPFYRRLFERVTRYKKYWRPYNRNFHEMNSRHRHWGNDVWLTSSLQDIIVDIYPDFYEKCIVHVKENWKSGSDSMERCNAVSLQYTIQWPLDIIITSTQIAVYEDIFQFILKIKWGLYTLTHLYFTVNLLTNIQHYIFSFIFTKCLQKIETDFEKAYDLSSIMKCHSEFVNDIRLMTMDLRASGEGNPPFDTILSCVNTLKLMWSNIENATIDRLYSCQKSYEDSYKAMCPILFPKFIYDY